MIYNDLLDNFLDEIIGFESDRSPEVRKFVVGFIEAACIKDPDYFSRLLVNLNYFLNETNSNVIKKTIQTGTLGSFSIEVFTKNFLAKPSKTNSSNPFHQPPNCSNTSSSG